MLIVLSGEAGAGKDSVAKLLVEKHGFVSYSLAGPLKRFAEDMFGFSKEQLYGPSRARNAADPRWNLDCQICDGTGEVEVHHVVSCCGRCDGKGKIEISPRSTLQPLGCEYLRDMIHPDVLTIRASWDIGPMLEEGKDIVVSDARFSNDRDNLREWFGGFRVDVRAPDKKNDGAGWRLHESETDRPTLDQVEYIILNREEWPFPGLPKLVQAMLDEFAVRMAFSSP